MKKINVAIVGYGHLGEAVEECLQADKKFKLVDIFSRREIITKHGKKCKKLENLYQFVQKIDVLLICLSSFADIEKYCYNFANKFCFVDCYDTHRRLNKYLSKLNSICKENNTVCLCSFGWDPGLFSLQRILFDEIFEGNNSQTFWGKGVSQGHSNAIRQIDDVKNAVSFTIPNKTELKKYKNSGIVCNNKKHIRKCYVSLESGADKSVIASKIKNIKYYFKNQTTLINFVNDNKVNKLCKKISHKGQILKFFEICGYKNGILFKVNMQSNPHFTAKLMLAGAVAVYNMKENKKYGAYSVLDIPPKSFTLKTSKKYYKYL